MPPDDRPGPPSAAERPRTWFESTPGHRWFNPSQVEAVLLWINTPPTF